MTMSPRALPYAATPGRALLQVLADVFVLLWLVAWYYVARAVHSAVAAFAEVGRNIQHGAGGVTHNLDSAGDTASKVPLVGNALRTPLRAAGSAANDIASAGHGLDVKATALSVLLALAVSVPPALAVLVPWLLLRIRFARRAGEVASLARTAGGDRLLALRALANRPLRRVTAAAGPDALEAWTRGDPEVVARLARLELRAAGLK
jgi:hypothetical protein